MGSLSPKTRNAQVDLYQSGDVDFLIATDAIGMGINMDIDHVYFSGLKKFDGKKIRNLRDSEIGQISGRAGRYMNNGSFGTTGNCESLTDEQIEKLETHKFDDVVNIYWRNSNLDFSSYENLLQTLNQKPQSNYLVRNKDLLDENNFKFLVSEKSNIKIKNEEYFVKLLWECCQIPDFTKSSYNEHIDIISKVFNFLSSDKGKITNEWMKNQLASLNNFEGNIDSIANRISYVRTWSYVSNKRNWVENSDFWIARTKDIEDKLSEKLHEELSKSFVDKRISVLSKGLKQDIKLNTQISENNEIFINDHYIGKINGLKIELNYSQSNLETDIKSLKKAARNGAKDELSSKINEIIQNPDFLELKEDCKIYWNNQKISEIKPGKNYLNPKIKLLIDETVDQADFLKLQDFLEQWIDSEKKKSLKDLISIEKSNFENPESRGLCYQLFENNGVLKRDLANNLLKIISKEERYQLRTKGIKIGKYHVYQPRMIRPKAIQLKTILWKCYYGLQKIDYPNFGLNFIKNFKNKDKKFMLICGFETFGQFIIRIDILEKLFVEILSRSKDYSFQLDAKLLNLLGCSKENFIQFIKYINYEMIEDKDNTIFKFKPKKQKSFNKVSKNKNAFSILEKINI